ncbi:MAG: transposase [Desulfobacteraceae bacterium]|nr:transposase [Desulfobacteraceae bacterium]
MFKNLVKSTKTFALFTKKLMYKHNLKQMEFENFDLPFDGRLRSDNRRVKLAKFIPWEEFEIAYAKNFSSSGVGPPAMSVRIAMGALIIKEELGASDEETVEQIRENPYLQYFLGFTDYCDKKPFHPTMFVHFRKRFGKKAICRITGTVNQKARVTKRGKLGKLGKLGRERYGRGWAGEGGAIVFYLTILIMDVPTVSPTVLFSPSADIESILLPQPYVMSMLPSAVYI